MTGDQSNTTLNDSISLSGPASNFMSQNGGGCTGPMVSEASARFFFTSPSAGGTSVMEPRGFYTHFWWSNPVNVALATGNQPSITITAHMANPGEWSDWNGQNGATQTEAFVEAAHNVQSIGLSFGGECFFENGVTAVGNSTNIEQFSSDFTES